LDILLNETRKALRDSGYAFVRATQMREAIAPTSDGVEAFTKSWSDLGVDTYMADGGRYRRRRFSTFAVATDSIERKPHQPHYQSRDYNPLHGGIERWFEPISDDVVAHSIFQSCLRLCCELFDSMTDDPPPIWHVEVHQFRIEAKRNERGLPTPEGLHRDGVDWVLVLLIARENIAEGMTSIHDANKRLLGNFTLTDPFDAAFVDDSRVYHGVTAVEPIDPATPAYRDVLVVTFRRP
jgi:hypothetical protein